MYAAVKASEEVRGWLAAAAVETVYIALGLLRTPAKLIVLVEQHLERVRIIVEVSSADPAKEGATVCAVIEPVVLLP
jgi:hypothetical protein